MKNLKAWRKQKNDISDKSVGKEPHEIIKQYVNDELEEIIGSETNRYAVQKNTSSTFSVENWLILTGHHSLPRTCLFQKKECDMALSIVYKSITRKQFADFQVFCW